MSVASWSVDEQSTAAPEAVQLSLLACHAHVWLGMLHQAHVKLLEVADSVSLEELNAIAASVLSYISHYRNEAALLEEVGPDPVSKGYAHPGPSRMTSIVACVPAFMDASGQSTGQ